MSIQRNLILRADANTTIGFGHLYRLIALGEICKSHFEVVFVIKDVFANDLIPDWFKVVLIPEVFTLEQEATWFAQNFLIEDSLLVLDGYNFDTIYQKKIKKEGFKLVYVDDLQSFEQVADVVVNHAPGVLVENYNCLPTTQLCVGLDYALLRPPFFDLSHKAEIEKIKNVAICFGGSNPMNLTESTLDLVLQLPQFNRITVITDRDHSKELEQNYKNEISSEKVKVLSGLNAEEIVKHICNNDLMIGASSTIAIETLACKTYLYAVQTASNQEFIFKGIEKYDVVCTKELIGNIQSITKEELLKVILKFEQEKPKKFPIINPEKIRKILQEL